LAVSAADASDPGGGAAGAFVALAGTLALLGGLAVGVARTRRRDPSDEEEPFAAADTESADDVGAARIS
jgi:hypothetical protein